MTNKVGKQDHRLTSSAIIVFLRKPELGKVKTRLAKTLGGREALAIYHTLIEKTLNNVLACRLSTYLFFFPKIDSQILQSYPSFISHLQKGEDLGSKMFEAFEEILQKHAQAIIIGTDCPYLTPELLAEAQLELEQHDVVIGPAQDGGYYLIGLKENDRKLFTNINWSTDTVFRETISIIEDQQKTYYSLPVLSDIDFEEDWNHYQDQEQT